MVFQPRDYEEFTRQLARDQSQSREGEVVTVDVSGATLQRMADYRRLATPFFSSKCRTQNFASTMLHLQTY